MMVAPVDQGDRNRRAGQPERRLQAAEAGADDDDAVAFARSRLLFRHLRWPQGFGLRFRGALRMAGNFWRSRGRHSQQISRSHRFPTRTIILAIRGAYELWCMVASGRPLAV